MYARYYAKQTDTAEDGLFPIISTDVIATQFILFLLFLFYSNRGILESHHKTIGLATTMNVYWKHFNLFWLAWMAKKFILSTLERLERS